jgi:hypothetical protein
LIDPDEFATRAPNGDILVVDDGSQTEPQRIQRIALNGNVSTFLTEAQIEAVTGVDLNPEGGLAFDSNGDLFLAETTSGTILKFDSQLNGMVWVSKATIQAATGAEPELTGQIAFAPVYKLYFAQFADGLGLFSQIILIALSDESATNAQIILRKPNGEPMSVDLNGEMVEGQLENVVILPDGTAVFTTDGQGDLIEGSATVCSDQRLVGVIVFGGGTGLAGVPNSVVLTKGFRAPILEEGDPPSTRTGFAVMNLESEEVILSLELFDEEGNLLATGQLLLTAMGQETAFPDEIQWDNPVDFSDFKGSMRVAGTGRIAAAVIQLRPGQFATLPVAATD